MKTKNLFTIPTKFGSIYAVVNGEKSLHVSTDGETYGENKRDSVPLTVRGVLHRISGMHWAVNKDNKLEMMTYDRGGKGNVFVSENETNHASEPGYYTLRGFYAQKQGSFGHDDATTAAKKAIYIEINKAINKFFDTASFDANKDRDDLYAAFEKRKSNSRIAKYKESKKKVESLKLELENARQEFDAAWGNLTQDERIFIESNGEETL